MCFAGYKRFLSLGQTRVCPSPLRGDRAGRLLATMLQPTVLAVCVAAAAFSVWHCRAMYRRVAPQPVLGGRVRQQRQRPQVVTRPDFHRRMLQHATEFGAIFSMRLIWFKVRSAKFRESPCLA